MKNNIFLDVIIPVYNTKQYLDKCIKSVLLQNFKNYRIILVDDGSTDGSSSTCDEYSNKFTNVITIHKKNGGLSSARNEGLKYARADYVTFLDSDDYLSKGALEFAYSSAKKTNYADLLVFNLIRESLNSDPIKEAGVPIVNKKFTKKEYFNTILANYIYIISCCKLIKRIIFNDVSFDLGKIHEDEFIIHKIINKCTTSIYTFDFVFYHYVDRSDSIMNSFELTSHCFDSVEALINRSVYLKKRKYFKAAIKNYIVAIELYFNIRKKYKNLFDKKINSPKKHLYSNEFCNNYLLYQFYKWLYFLKIVKYCIKKI